MPKGYFSRPTDHIECLTCLEDMRYDCAGTSDDEVVTKVPVGVAALRIGGAAPSSTSSSRLSGCAQTDGRLPDGSGLSSAAWASGGGSGCVITGLHAKALPGEHRLSVLCTH